ncbi:MAG: DUF3263 domain-containing protein [Actinomycetota bacterium]|nr:DUF3263 domain-containing protein [Actinomycetota bacterium]
MTALTDQEKAILDFAGRTYRFTGKQEADMILELDLQPTTYWRKVNDLIERQEALAYAPMTVHRLRRQRAVRQRARSARARGLKVDRSA